MKLRLIKCKDIHKEFCAKWGLITAFTGFIFCLSRTLLPMEQTLNKGIFRETNKLTINVQTEKINLEYNYYDSFTLKSSPLSFKTLLLQLRLSFFSKTIEVQKNYPILNTGYKVDSIIEAENNTFGVVIKKIRPLFIKSFLYSFQMSVSDQEKKIIIHDNLDRETQSNFLAGKSLTSIDMVKQFNLAKSIGIRRYRSAETYNLRLWLHCR